MRILKNVSFKSSKVRIVPPYELTRNLVIRPRDAGCTLLDFFAGRFPFLPAAEWERRIHNGWFRAGDRLLTPDEVLKPNQLIRHYNPSVKEPAVPDGVKILEEQEDWLIVYKPAPLPMHQGGRYYKNTLISILGEMGYPGVRMVHRIDSVTSGLVIVARNKPAALKLHQLFGMNRVQKSYYAMVRGAVPFNRVTADAPVRRKHGFVFECGKDLAGAKPSATEIQRVTVFGDRSLVKCIPVTGRTHQIRLHLQYIGYPVLDDPIYGPEGDASGKKLQNTAIMLQSSGLVLPELSIHKEIGVPGGWMDFREEI